MLRRAQMLKARARAGPKNDHFQDNSAQLAQQGLSVLIEVHRSEDVPVERIGVPRVLCEDCNERRGGGRPRFCWNDG